LEKNKNKIAEQTGKWGSTINAAKMILAADDSQDAIKNKFLD